jgi:hypothetical protein
VGRCDEVVMSVIDQCFTIGFSTADELPEGIDWFFVEDKATEVLSNKSSRPRQESCTSEDKKLREDPVQHISTERRASSGFLEMRAVPVTDIVKGVVIVEVELE